MSPTTGELRGTVAVITGAAQGMGRAVAERFASEGAYVVLVDQRPEEVTAVASALRDRGFPADAKVADISEEREVQQLVDATMRERGQVDSLVNAAGIMYPTRFHDLSLMEWDRVMKVNVRGTFLMMRAVYPHMMQRGAGAIVNFSSTAGLTVSTLGGAHYTASKHAVMGLTKAVAKEGGAYGVRVNAVCPGLIDTEMVRATINRERLEGYEASFPIPRLGTPAEVADLVLFLVSTRSSYITGASLNISGGDLL
jgi:NAD(P)-dependent dehydrogenase (short-subunit alcohol dehydrogenase family)